MKAKNQDSVEKMMNLTEEFKAMLASIMDHINTLKSSPTQKDCINISSHALMGRPAARLEMMALVIRSYVIE